MSGITPLLDTLLHQVLGKNVDLQAQNSRSTYEQASGSFTARPVRPVGHQDEESARLNRQRQAYSVHQKAGTEIHKAGFGQLGRSAQEGAVSELSTSARLISRFLASAKGQASAIQPNHPLFSGRITAITSSELARLLSASIRYSGLFYESHLALWHDGRWSAQELAKEPQMMIGKSLTSHDLLPRAVAEQATDLFTARVQNQEEQVRRQLAALVGQQLQLLGEKELIWQGEILAGLPVFIEIRSGKDSLPANDESEQETWRLVLELTLPVLGWVKATITQVKSALTIDLIAEQAGVLGSSARILSDSLAEILQSQVKLSIRYPEVNNTE